MYSEYIKGFELNNNLIGLDKNVTVNAYYIRDIKMNINIYTNIQIYIYMTKIKEEYDNKYENGLFIFRRDLRIVDNNGLNLLNQVCKNIFTIFN